MVYRTVAQNCKTRQTNLCTPWVHFKIANDTIPHMDPGIPFGATNWHSRRNVHLPPCHSPCGSWLVQITLHLIGLHWQDNSVYKTAKYWLKERQIHRFRQISRFPEYNLDWNPEMHSGRSTDCFDIVEKGETQYYSCGWQSYSWQVNILLFLN